ncbi:thiol reductant ABC exporter subunit CydD [Celeribacter marinus]|uniref:thiol reductant ABC exporter subunit CydD n=1 Tax=Celeribacter marinus TaxID=1397108 RepID=UPI003F6D205C
MTSTTPNTIANDTDSPVSRVGLMAAGAAQHRRASVLSVASGLLWPVQAAVVAYALGGLLNGQTVFALGIAIAFAGLGLLRAGLTMASEAYAQAAAQTIIHRARAHIVAVEARRAADSPFGGAGAITALASEKLDLLVPFITRYAPARARVMVVPLVILMLALSQSWAVALVLMISGPLIPIFMALIGMAAKETSQKHLREIGNLNDMLVERLSALVDIRLLGARDAVLDGFSGQATDLRHRTMAVLRVAFLSSTVLELFAAIGVAMVAVYVGFSLLGTLGFGTWNGALTPQVGIFLLLLTPEFYQPLRDLSAAWHDKAAADAVFDELHIWDAQQTAVLMGQGGACAPLTGAPSIALRGCALHNGTVLADIDIAAGESVAIMGPSGAGKTTALRLMAGLEGPNVGQITLAGVALTDATADPWRARVGWMPQAPHFLNASVRHNVQLGRAGDLSAALEHAAVEAVINRLPQGLNTRLGETGGGLSGGEARRVTLARAIFGEPDVIIADEPTADLDRKTANAVTNGLLAQVARGATVIVATHDPDLAAKMDRIISIEALQ